MKKITILVFLSLFFGPVSLMLNRADAVNNTPLFESIDVADVAAINVPGFGEATNLCTINPTLCETAPENDSEVEAFAEGNGNTVSDEHAVPCAPASEVPCPIIVEFPDVEVIDLGNGNTPSEESAVPCAPASEVPCPIVVELPDVEVIDLGNGNTPSEPTPTGNGGGGGFIFPPTTPPITPPTSPVNSDQQVLGEQIFADTTPTPTQPTLGEIAETSVLGEQVTSPTFPKTGAAPITSNSILWQLSLTLILLSVLLISFNQKKTIVASK